MEGMNLFAGKDSKPLTQEERERFRAAVAKLEAALLELDAIRPVQFRDESTWNTYNFLSVSVEDTRVYVEVSQEWDNLPTHEEHPLLNRKGEPILPQPQEEV